MSDIEVGDPRSEMMRDARSGTQNTKLAAALLTMGFQLAKQPFTTVPRMRHGQLEGADTTIWFIPVLQSEGVRIEFDVVEREWKFRPTADYNNSPFPQVVWMRCALQAREDTLRKIVKAPPKNDGTPIGAQWFVTDSVNMASCLIGADYHLNLYRDRKFYFNPDAARAAGVYMRKEGGREVMQWMRKAVEQIEILVSAIRGPNNSPLLRIANETSGSTLTISADAPDDLQRSCLNELHKS